MLTFAAEGNGQGRLEINGHSEPVAYELIVAQEEDDTHQVRIRLNAPRDWLLKQGFQGEAVLVRDNGARIAVRREGGKALSPLFPLSLPYSPPVGGNALPAASPALRFIGASLPVLPPLLDENFADRLRLNFRHVLRFRRVHSGFILAKPFAEPGQAEIAVYGRGFDGCFTHKHDCA